MERTNVIASGKRIIGSGAAYNRYFPKPEERDRVIIKDGEVEDTVRLMEKVVWKYIDDTKLLVPLLKRSTVEATCQAIWEFLYTTIQYKLDKEGLEQLRRPARSWQERKSGVDCDCLSIFASSILTNLQIPHCFRITKYSVDYWQHVYVVASDENGEQYIIDAVVSQFNYEKPYSEKMDYTMSLKGINVAVLSGIENNDLTDVLFANELSGLGANSEDELDLIYEHLLSTRRAIARDPKLVATTDDPIGLLKMLDYAIQYWNTDKRNEALSILEKNEVSLNQLNGFSSINGYAEDDSLGALSIKKFFTTVKKAVADTGKGVKVATKAIIKFNPLSIAARNGFLLAMKLNVGKMATHLKWGYATKEQAQKKGINEAQWLKAKDSKEKVEKLFADKLQGSKTALQNAVLKGKGGNLNGYVENQMLGLGDPLTATSIAAAAPIIAMVIDILKKAGSIAPGEVIDENSIAKEIAADPSSASALQTIEAETASDAINPIVKPATDSPSESIAKGGIIGLIKANPVPAAIGGGLLALGIYKIVTPSKKKPAASLNGIKKPIKKKPIQKHKAKKKKKTQPSLSLKKMHIKTLILK